MRRRLTIHWQLTLWFGACLALGALLFGAGTYLLFGRYLLAEIDFALEEEITEVIETVRQSSAGEVSSKLNEYFGDQPFYAIQVVAPTGEIVFRTPARERLPVPFTSPPLGEFRHRTFERGAQVDYRTIARSVRTPEGEYHVIVGETLKTYHRTLERLVWSLLVLGPVVALATLGGGYYLSRRALAPVDRLTRAALETTAQDLASRVPRDETPDEIGHLATAFNVMLERLEAAFADVRRFTADAAHELRTPLSILRTRTEMALRERRSVQEHRELLTKQLAEIERLTRLIDHLLFLCREDAGLREVDCRVVRLDLLLEEIGETMQPLILSREIRWECDELPVTDVEASHDHLRRLFLNLIDNAIRHGRRRGRVEVRLHLTETDAIAHVVDDGGGIAEEHLPRVFERFYRIDSSRNRATGGSGLGLSICRRIIDSLGGELHLQSVLGQGTTAEVRLPRRAPSAGRSCPDVPKSIPSPAFRQ